VNRQNQFLQERRNKQLFLMADWKVDSCRFSAANSQEHEMLKALLCYMLTCQGHHFLTEARTKDCKFRADVVDLTDGIIYEVAVSEKEQSTDLKKAAYPLPVQVVKKIETYTAPADAPKHFEGWRIT